MDNKFVSQLKGILTDGRDLIFENTFLSFLNGLKLEKNETIDEKLIQKVNNLVAMANAMIYERNFFIGLARSFTEYVEALRE